MKRLFVGVISTEKRNDTGGHDINIETFVGWANNREEALGSWMDKVREMHPTARIASFSAHDITEIAKEGMTNGAYA